MRYEFVSETKEGPTHSYLRVEFESGIFVRDYAIALQQIELAYNRLEYLESESERLIDLVDQSTSREENTYEFRRFIERRIKRLESEPRYEGPYGDMLDILALDFFRSYSDRGLAGAVAVREFLDRRLFTFPVGYVPKPERALVLDESSLHSLGFNDLLGIGKVVEVIAGAVGKYKVDSAKATKLKADSLVSEAKARKTDAECEVLRAKAMKERAEAMTKTFTALQKLGLSPDEAQELIARELRTASNEVRPSIESGIIQSMSSLPYQDKDGVKSGIAAQRERALHDPEQGI
jgi:hypothetical protein